MTKVQYVFELEKGDIVLDTLDEARDLKNKINHPYKVEYVTINPEKPSYCRKTNVTK